MPLNPYQLQVFNQWKACFTEIKISETVLEAALENMPDNVTLDVMYATCRMLRKFSYPIDAAWQLVSCSGSPAWVAKPLKDFNKATNLIAGAWGPAEYAASSGHLQSVATIL